MSQHQHQLLALAISIASTAHKDDLDKGGKAYILHPIRIMMRLRTDDAELMQIAILHDVLEDHPDLMSIPILTRLGFSTRVTYALSLLTHDNTVSYSDYIIAIFNNVDATAVKLEDLRDNSDITRLKGVTEKDIIRMKKYHHAFLFLSGKLPITAL